jgi:anti-sigma-K factor RskA
MTHDEIRGDLSSFALDVLDADERRAIEEHLHAGCAECERELASWQEVVGVMALAANDEKSPDFKPALLQRVHAPAASSKAPAKVIQLRRWVAVPLAAAALAVLTIGVIRDVDLRGRLTGQRLISEGLRQELEVARGSLRQLEGQLAAKESDVASLRAALVAAEQSLAVVQAPNLRMVRLEQTPDAQPSRGHVLIDAESGRALFYAFDLAPLPAEKTYELWWITEKEGPVNAGLFRPDTRGVGRVEAAVPGSAGAIQAAAVTIEPAGGVSKPTGPMVLLGDV